MHSAARRLTLAAAAALAPSAGVVGPAWTGAAAAASSPLLSAIGQSAGLHTGSTPASTSTDIRAVMAEKIPVQQVCVCLCLCVRERERDRDRERERRGVCGRGVGAGPAAPHEQLGSRVERAASNGRRARERGARVPLSARAQWPSALPAPCQG